MALEDWLEACRRTVGRCPAGCLCHGARQSNTAGSGQRLSQKDESHQGFSAGSARREGQNEPVSKTFADIHVQEEWRHLVGSIKRAFWHAS
uniref:Uncharacterized protein n=1 Tax=Takifugu rubripes TaxID=31033 RepID=A0A3B5KPR4_TAKRU